MPEVYFIDAELAEEGAVGVYDGDMEMIKGIMEKESLDLSYKFIVVTRSPTVIEFLRRLRSLRCIECRSEVEDNKKLLDFIKGELDRKMSIHINALLKRIVKRDLRLPTRTIKELFTEENLRYVGGYIAGQMLFRQDVVCKYCEEYAASHATMCPFEGALMICKYVAFYGPCVLRYLIHRFKLSNKVNYKRLIDESEYLKAAGFATEGATVFLNGQCEIANGGYETAEDILEYLGCVVGSEWIFKGIHVRVKEYVEKIVFKFPYVVVTRLGASDAFSVPAFALRHPSHKLMPY